MAIWELTADDVEAVVTQMKQGRSIKEIAVDLDISEEMALCAVRKWPSLQKRRKWFELF